MRVRKVWTLAASVFTFFVALFSLSLKLSVPIMQLYEKESEIGTLSPSVPILEEPGGVALCDLPWFVEERQTQEKAGLLHLCRRAGVLTVQQGGRLGNQIWEYASVWGLSQEAPWLTPVVPRCLLRAIDDAFPFLTVPELNDTILQRGCAAGIRPEPEPALSRSQVLKMLKECQNERKEMDQGCCKENIVLQRWVALPELVLPRLDVLRAQEFRFHPYLIDLASSFLTAVKQHTGATVFVSIHVRRGDYDEYLHCKHNASLAPAAFYEEAMNRFRRYIKEKVAFIVISDDIAWCRANIVTLRRDIFVAWDAVAGWKESTENLAGVPESDLALMAHCNHTVLDYGSFGTWGALLSGGRTITYGINGLLSTFVGETLNHWEIIPLEKFY